MGIIYECLLNRCENVQGIVKSLPSQSSMGVADSNRHGLSPLHIHRISETTMKHVTTSGPKTAFERQVQDFRERLWVCNEFSLHTDQDFVFA
uniref:Uncharacterized protein n=1 Tax=Parascaris equorum TaxID=6256 RepID=A0A914S781_PAREQ